MPPTLPAVARVENLRWWECPLLADELPLGKRGEMLLLSQQQTHASSSKQRLGLSTTRHTPRLPLSSPLQNLKEIIRGADLAAL